MDIDLREPLRREVKHKRGNRI